MAGPLSWGKWSYFLGWYSRGQAQGGIRTISTPSTQGIPGRPGPAGSGADLENIGAPGRWLYPACAQLLRITCPPVSGPGFAIGPESWGGLALSVCPQVDTASEVEELEADGVSLLPAALPEGSGGGARIQVFLARYRWAPHPCSLCPGHLACMGGRGRVQRWWDWGRDPGWTCRLNLIGRWAQ